jgi:hypothetical protein
VASLGGARWHSTAGVKAQAGVVGRHNEVGGAARGRQLAGCGWGVVGA